MDKGWWGWGTLSNRTVALIGLGLVIVMVVLMGAVMLSFVDAK